VRAWVRVCVCARGCVGAWVGECACVGGWMCVPVWVDECACVWGESVRMCACV
jgi:hypothetical protein